MSDQIDVKTRDEFLALVKEVLSDREYIEGCENHTTERFLEALVAWLTDAHDMDFGDGVPLDTESPSWQLFGKAIYAATAYE
ncbi:hypothetical protein OT109_05755 [Phycisphaeraceae bacterium D3-23]